jgi:hypothetical protein
MEGTRQPLLLLRSRHARRRVKFGEAVARLEARPGARVDVVLVHAVVHAPDVILAAPAGVLSVALDGVEAAGPVVVVIAVDLVELVQGRVLVTVRQSASQRLELPAGRVRPPFVPEATPI